MKAIRQIIDYLHGQGVLDERQMAELVGRGFVETDPDASADGREDDSSGETVGGAAPEEDLPHHGRSGRAARRRGRVQRKGPVLTLKGLLGRLRECFRSWPGELAGLVAIGRRLDGSATWQDAALAVRNAELKKLTGAVEAALGEREPTLDVLWDAVALETYRCTDGTDLYGPVAAAYRALLGSNDTAQLGRHAKLLRHWPVAQVYNVRLAQRRLARAFGAVFSDRPDLIAASVLRDYHPLAYWSLVLLYNARRGSPGRRPPPDYTEREPQRPRPDDVTWVRAWAEATAMDPRAVAAFLVDYEQLTRRPPADRARHPDLVCPRAWDFKTWE